MTIKLMNFRMFVKKVWKKRECFFVQGLGKAFVLRKASFHFLNLTSAGCEHGG